MAATLAIAYLVIRPDGADLPAQLYRASLFARDGVSLWDNGWYAGHNLLGYSVLFPALAWLTTPLVIAAIASVVTAAAFEALVHARFGADAWLGATWLGAATATELVSGRLTFALGLAGAALTALALQRRHSAGAALAALFTALSSPVAALFAALAGAALVITGPTTGRRAVGAGVVLAALLPVVGLAVAFPEGGHQPFALSTLWPVLLAALALLAIARRAGIGGAVSATEAAAIGLYAAGCVAAYVLSTPVGANAARLGELVAGPMAALYLYRRPLPRTALALLVTVAFPLTYIQVKDAVTDTAHGSAGHTYTRSYFEPLLDFLSRQPGMTAGLHRIEIPFTEGHWETYFVASQYPLARGWERQLDIRYDGLFYDGRGTLTARSYETWLHQLAVSYVAVANAPADFSARREIDLIDHGLPYLRLVARLPHWRVYAVAHPTPIVSGAATLTRLSPAALALDATHTGTADVRVHWSPYWQLEGVRGCVAPAGQFTALKLRGTGPARLVIRFSLGRIGSRSPRCN